MASLIRKRCWKYQTKLPKNIISRFSSSTEKVEKIPWQKYMIGSSVVVIGLPVIISTAFVWNLIYDEEFKNHFDDKYPDLLNTIRRYVSIDPEGGCENQTNKKKDSKPVEVLAMVWMKSGKYYELKVLSNANISDIQHQINSKYQENKTDSIQDVTFKDIDTEDGIDNDSEENKEDKPDSINENEEVDPSTTSTWPKERPQRASKKVSPATRIEWEINGLQGKIQQFEKEKLSGFREIDVIDQDIQVLKQQKKQLQDQLNDISLSSRQKKFYFF